MLEILQYGFMQRAFIAGILLSVICSIVGLFLVLRRLSLLGDGIAHVAFGGIAFGMLLKIPPIISALIFSIVGSLGVQKLIQKTKIYGESATALILSMGVGIGVIVIGIVKGFNVDLFSYLFGSILTISLIDILLICIIFILTLVFLTIYYRPLVLMTFNEDIALTSGVKVQVISTIFSILAAMTIVVSIRAVGILLISALLVIPAITALQIANSFKKALAYSIIFSATTILLGIITSFYLDLPTGGSIVVLMCAGFFIISFLNSLKKND